MIFNPVIVGGGTKLPELTNPGTAADLLDGKQLINQDGAVLTGTMPVRSFSQDFALSAPAPAGLTASVNALSGPSGYYGVPYPVIQTEMKCGDSFSPTMSLSHLGTSGTLIYFSFPLMASPKGGANGILSFALNLSLLNANADAAVWVSVYGPMTSALFGGNMTALVFGTTISVSSIDLSLTGTTLSVRVTAPYSTAYTVNRNTSSHYFRVVYLV